VLGDSGLGLCLNLWAAADDAIHLSAAKIQFCSCVGGGRVCVWMCVCVYVRERARERESACVYV